MQMHSEIQLLSLQQAQNGLQQLMTQTLPTNPLLAGQEPDPNTNEAAQQRLLRALLLNQHINRLEQAEQQQLYDTLVAESSEALQVIRPPAQSVLPVGPMPVNDPGVALIPYGELPLRDWKAYIMSYAYNPNYVSARKTRLQEQRIENGGIVPYSLYTPCVIYVIYAIDLPQLGVYVGLTFKTAIERGVEHIHAWRAHSRTPRGGRHAYTRAYRLYEMWTYYGLHRFAWMAFEQLGEPRDYRDAAEFDEVHASAEGSVIDRLQALWPHGFNVRNTPDMDSRIANWERNMRRGRHARDRASWQHGIRPQDQAVTPGAITMAAASTTSMSAAAPLPANTSLQAGPSAASTSTHVPGDPGAFSSYARTAHSILTVLWRHSVDQEFDDFNNTPTLSISHPVVQHLLQMNQSTVSKVLYVLEQSSIDELQGFCSALQPSAMDQFSTWTLDHSLFVRCCLKAHLRLVARQDPLPDLDDRRLLIVNFSSAPGLDKVSLNAIFNDPFITSLIPPHFQRQVGKPFQVFKNSATIGSDWFNAKHIAQMSGTELLKICNTTCCCSAYDDVDKQDGHLLTTNCDILPSQALAQLGKMGAKYRPHDCPSHLNSASRSEILAVLHEAVSRFVREAETRVKHPGSMRAWQSEVDVRIAAAVAALPDGTFSPL